MSLMQSRRNWPNSRALCLSAADSVTRLALPGYARIAAALVEPDRALMVKVSKRQFFSDKNRFIQTYKTDT